MNLNPTEEALLREMLARYRSQKEQKAGTTICILAENSNEGKNLQAYLRKKGFEKASVCKPGEAEALKADLVIFDRHRGNDPDYYHNLSDPFLQEYIKTNWRRQSLLYFGPRNPALDVRMTETVFANYRRKLEGNLLELLDDLSTKD